MREEETDPGMVSCAFYFILLIDNVYSGIGNSRASPWGVMGFMEGDEVVVGTYNLLNFLIQMFIV